MIFLKETFISANIFDISMPETMSLVDEPTNDTDQDQEGDKNVKEVNTSAFPLQGKTNYGEKVEIRLYFVLRFTIQ